MPVKLEQLQQPNAEDLKDLIKIYLDYPDTADYSEQQLQQWINSNLSDGKQLLVGRFNSRLATAAWLQQSGQQLSLSQLCVRKATRQRGVARQLLQLLTQSPLIAGHSVHIANGADNCPISQLLAELGFKADASGWLFEADV